jgi:hypothetical protein
MKKQLLLFRLVLVLIAIPIFMGTKLFAQQDTIPKLIITELNASQDARNYIEITNIGDTAINLKHFGLGSMQFWVTPYTHHNQFYSYMPEYVLEPGESFVTAAVSDWAKENMNPLDYDNSGVFWNYTPDAYWEHVDWEIHRTERPGDPTDSTSAPLANMLRSIDGQSGYFIEYFFPNGDSAIIDAVNNEFNPETGLPTNVASDVAGILNGTDDHILVRKTTITKGNLDWEQAKGVDAEDSEWIALPFHHDYLNPRQKHFTTLGNHDAAEISSSSISSSNISIDFDNGTMDVPWGIYRDSIMFEFDLGNGLAWNYHKLGTVEDSVFYSVRTGDTLVMWAVGPSRQEQMFHLNVLEATNDMNHVLPVYRRLADFNDNGEWIVSYQQIFKVTENQPGMDSITRVGFGERVDTLFKYLEKPSNADWEIIWVDGNERPDLKRGDILRVTAQNGDVKDYFISADEVPEPSENARLATIIWPDVPEYTLISPAWGGEMEIPGFLPSITSYQFTVPYGLGIPALKAVPEDLNAKISVKRATNLNGSVEERSTVFTVMAEDSTVIEYSILFQKEVPSVNLQPFHAEPLVSEMVFRQNTQMNYLEIVNVGNQPLDLSKYLITSHRDGFLNNPSDAITWNAADYLYRYTRWVIGYDYVTEEEWAAKPGYLKLESYDPIVEPGDVFVFGFYRGRQEQHKWQAPECDVIIDRCPLEFDEFEGIAKKIIDAEALGLPQGGTVIDRAGGVFRDPVHIFKILNDSIFEGTKGVTDPSDFELVEVLGGYTDQRWLIDGQFEINMVRQRMWRKEQFWKPDTLGYVTFDSIPEKNQWYYMDRDSLEVLGYSNAVEMLGEGIGSHVFNPVTAYKSTISSKAYIASDGYKNNPPQTILGVVTNTSVSDFLNNIIKAEEGQSLKVVSTASGEELASDAVVADKDTLIVLSADSVNITKYVLSVTDDGLNSDAVLAAKDGSGYTVEVDAGAGTGSVIGISFGSALETVLGNLIKPSTASWVVTNQDDNLVALNSVNSDTVMVKTTASHLLSIEVTAQDGETKIVYSLVMDLGASDALLFSDHYTVDQDVYTVMGIPTGTRVPALFTNLLVSPGATAVLLDKAGNERTMGNVSFDDIVIVTSEDGSTVNTYYLQFMDEAEGTDAYVISDVLTVDQLNLTVSNIEESTTIDELISLLTPAPGAAMLIVDASDNEVTSGTVSEDHKVKVTSGNGAKVVYYSLSVLVSVINHDLDGISVYPNPTHGEFFIIGLRENSTVSVYNIEGQVIKIFEPKNINGGRISIEDQPAGMYFITINSGSYHLKTLRVIKK